MHVEADIYADGHDELAALLLYRRQEETAWQETPMRFLVNDRWAGSFVAAETGSYIFTITAWVDRFQTWRRDLKKRLRADKKTWQYHLTIGDKLMSEVRRRASRADKPVIKTWLDTLKSATATGRKKIDLVLSEEVGSLMAKYADRQYAATYPKELAVRVERERAGCSAWYEMFPHSVSAVPGQHGTFRDCEARLPYIAAMGFDVLYLPPIHPVGQTNRKGKNNAVTAKPGDPGTPWAIGAEEGGHKAINPRAGHAGGFPAPGR